MVKVKICGITTQEAATTALESGADFIGFVFYPKSPRYIEPHKAKEIADSLPVSIKKVGLFVEPTDQQIQEIYNENIIDYIQLHGHETPERAKHIRKHFPGLKIIKALPISNESSIDVTKDYSEYVDWFLFDAPESALPGGNGIPFDWNLVKNIDSMKPWFLAGGLNASNVYGAIKETQAHGVDVSSGVEIEPGKKDLKKIQDFIKEAKK